MLSRSGLTSNTPIVGFVTRQRCRHCGSQSVLATRTPADRPRKPPDATRCVPYAAINRKKAYEQNKVELVPLGATPLAVTSARAEDRSSWRVGKLGKGL